MAALHKQVDKNYRFFFVVSASEETYVEWAHNSRLVLYNEKKQYPCEFNKFEQEDFEPFRDYHRHLLLMAQINKEFDIDKYLRKGMIERYLPSHDSQQARFI